MKINEFVPDMSIFNGSKDLKVQSKNDNGTFFETLQDKISEVNKFQIDSENLTSKFVKGEDVNMHDVMIASQEAKISLQYAVELRNKLIDAYQEINRIQI